MSVASIDAQPALHASRFIRHYKHFANPRDSHMIPQYAPSAAYRQLEFLLGRIDNLGVRGDFTVRLIGKTYATQKGAETLPQTQSGDFGNNYNFTIANISMH